MRRIMCLVALTCLLGWPGYSDETASALPIAVGTFEQQTHRAFTQAQGLPSNDVTRLTMGDDGRLVAFTPNGAAALVGDTWQAVPTPEVAGVLLDKKEAARLETVAGTTLSIRAVARRDGEVAVATDGGLYLGTGRDWQLALPQEGNERWAPVDVRAVAFDGAGQLWFAATQGVGCRGVDGAWKLYTGADGLPFNDFTCMATGPSGVWFGTSNGAIRFRDGAWSFRQGRRWLLGNHVRDILVDDAGRAWLATDGGVSCIEGKEMTLAQKAAFFSEEIEKHHRRTRFGFVDPAVLSSPGDKATAKPVFTDNDGHFTGLYLGAVSLGFAVTGDPRLKEKATGAFRALSFLSEVTEGGTHPAPKGFIARAVLPTTEPDPNPGFDLAYDLRRNKADSLWKIIQPRWPVDETGEWYWKNDSSSDELDGHFFGFAIYFDRVCTTEAEKDEVRPVVTRIMDHIIAHGYNLVDHDGKPTRWGRFSPDDMNRNEAWYDERGLNSLSILTYLTIAHRITGDEKYRKHYLDLALNHGYAMNGMTQPTSIAGPGMVGHQPDDNMAFMNYYHLIRYEHDPKLLNMYHHAIRLHWQYERRERNAFANFVYAACCLGKTRKDQWGEIDLTPPAACYDDAIDTLRRYPLDLVDWPVSNAHRIDLTPLRDEKGLSTSRAGGHDGRVLPIDERHEVYWDLDPWMLAYGGEGKRLREGVPFLLAYNMARAHGFIVE
jgi:hypothetical protein